MTPLIFSNFGIWTLTTVDVISLIATATNGRSASSTGYSSRIGGGGAHWDGRYHGGAMDY